MSNEKTKWWPLIIGHLVTIGIVLYSNNQTLEQLRANDTNEFKRRIFERRADAYAAISESVSRLILAAENKEEFEKVSIEFEKLYWQKIPFIDDSTVEEQMKLFRKDIGDYLYFDSESADILKRNGATLLEKCQESLYKTWNNSEE